MGQKTMFLVTNLVRAVSLEPLGFEISYFTTMLTMDERCGFYKKTKNNFVEKAIFRSFKNQIFVFLIIINLLLRLEACTRCISGTAWS